MCFNGPVIWRWMTSWPWCQVSAWCLHETYSGWVPRKRNSQMLKCHGCMQEWSIGSKFSTASFWNSAGWLRQHGCLIVSQAKNLEAYRQLKDFSFPDLSQYAKNSRARGELKDGCLMTLTTNYSKIFSEDPSGCWAILMSRTIIMMMKRIFLWAAGWDLWFSYMSLQEHGRFMQGKELLTAQTLPATRLQSETCRAPQLALGNVKASSLPKMAGNSMSVPCLGCVLLAAICCIEPIPKWWLFFQCMARHAQAWVKISRFQRAGEPKQLNPNNCFAFMNRPSDSDFVDHLRLLDQIACRMTKIPWPFFMSTWNWT